MLLGETLPTHRHSRMNLAGIQNFVALATENTGFPSTACGNDGEKGLNCPLRFPLRAYSFSSAKASIFPLLALANTALFASRLMPTMPTRKSTPVRGTGLTSTID